MTQTGSRRSMLRLLACGCLAAAAGPICTSPGRAASPGPRTTFNADQALQSLRTGNADFVQDKAQPVAMNNERRLEIANGQTPFAVVVGCSDSRVAPELLFGRGLGELFIVRVAGNSVDRTALGTVEYGVAVLGCPLIMVLGHERCGAVVAAIDAVKSDTQYPGAIGEMVAPIIPAVLRAQKMPGDLTENAVKENIRGVVRRLSTSDDILSGPVKKGDVKVVGAYYGLGNGVVELLGA